MLVGKLAPFKVKISLNLLNPLGQNDRVNQTYDSRASLRRKSVNILPDSVQNSKSLITSLKKDQLGAGVWLDRGLAPV
jgi:hypothetical protein